jgi:hypothetical protein
MEWVLKRSRPSFHFEVKSEFIVQLKGLPLDCSNDDIAHFMKGNSVFVCFIVCKCLVKLMFSDISVADVCVI